MKMFRLILSNGLLIAFAALLVWGYFNRAELFPDYFEAPAKTVAQTPAEKPVPPVRAPVTTREPTTGPAPEPMPTPPPIVSAPPASRAPQPIVAAPPTMTEPQPVIPAPPTARAPQPGVPSPPPVATPPAAPSAAPASQNNELIQEARQAYWSGDHNKAIERYRALIDRDPANPDYYGELGNLYYGAGEWEAASEAYLEAGKRLLGAGRDDQAGHLLRILRGLDPKKAAALEKHMAAAGPAR